MKIQTGSMGYKIPVSNSVQYRFCSQVYSSSNNQMKGIIQENKSLFTMWIPMFIAMAIPFPLNSSVKLYNIWQILYRSVVGLICSKIADKMI